MVEIAVSGLVHAIDILLSETRDHQDRRRLGGVSLRGSYGVLTTSASM